MQLGFGLSLTLPRGGASPFSPLSLFASGEQGAWFDASDLSSMDQNYLGGTPAVVGQSVGLVLDRSQGLPGPQLGNMDLKPSDFEIEGGSVVITDLGDRLRLTRTAAAAGGFQAECRSLPVQAGKTYEAEYKLLAVGGDRTVLAYTQIRNGGASAFRFASYQSAAATNRTINVATGAGSGTLQLALSVSRGAVPAASVEGDWIEVAKTFSVREMPGNHARQATATARPTLMQSGAVRYLYRDPVDDALPWTAPVGSYDVVHIPLTGPATVLTEQALSGATNILLAENTRAYLAIDRRLTAAEIAALTAYYGASA